MTIVTSDIQLYQILEQKMGEKEAEALVGFVDAKIRYNKEANQKILATKEDVSKIRTDFTKEMSTVKGELKADIARLDVKISDVKSDLIRWMFAFFVTLILAIIGTYFKS